MKLILFVQGVIHDYSSVVNELMSERNEAASWEENEEVVEEGDSWLEDEEVDEEEFGSLHPFIKSCVPGSTDEVLDT